LYIIVLINNNMYINSKIFSIVSFSFIFLLLILVNSSSSITIGPSLNSSVHIIYAQSGNGGNNRDVDTSAKVGDQIQPLGNNLQNAKTLSPDPSLTLSPSQDSKVEKNANNNPSLPALSFKSPSQSTSEKTVIPLSDSKSPNFNYKKAQGIAHVIIIIKNSSLIGSQTCLFTSVDKAPNSLVSSDPKCATISESDVSFSVQAPGLLDVRLYLGFSTGGIITKVDNECDRHYNIYISIGESKTCSLDLRYGK
jgi:hypothetical protein